MLCFVPCACITFLCITFLCTVNNISCTSYFPPPCPHVTPQPFLPLGYSDVRVWSSNKTKETNTYYIIYGHMPKPVDHESLSSCMEQPVFAYIYIYIYFFKA